MPPKRKLATVECPDCGSDNWQRIEMAYKLGTSEQSGTALIAGGGGLNVGALSGTAQTHFAGSIAPPPRRSANWAFLFGVVGALAIAVGGGIMTVLKDPMNEHTANFGLITLIFGLIPFAVCIIGLANASFYNEKRWPYMMEIWRRHFVCLKCGCIWIPGQSNQGP